MPDMNIIQEIRSLKARVSALETRQAKEVSVSQQPQQE